MFHILKGSAERIMCAILVFVQHLRHNELLKQNSTVKSEEAVAGLLLPSVGK